MVDNVNTWKHNNCLEQNLFSLTFSWSLPEGFIQNYIKCV